MANVVLAGNPNVGKSVIFQYLTGIYTEVSNFPGTTVEISKGKYRDDVLCDTPGIYGISSFSEEERIARDMILQADIVINVIDAAHFGRDLFLTLQLLDMGKKMLVCLNMMDEANKRGIAINSKRLETLLGVPVIETTAAKGENLEQLSLCLTKASTGKRTLEIATMAEAFLPICGNFAEAVLLLEDDDFLRMKYQQKPCGKREESYLLRRKRADKIVRETMTCAREENGGRQKRTDILLHPFYGSFILLGALLAVFLFLGVLVARYVVGFTENYLMKRLLEPLVLSFVQQWCKPESFFGQLFIGEYGLFTMVPSYLFGLILPLVLGFYFVLSLLEDSGYLPRIAVLADRFLNRIGLNGRAVIPMILGFGCVTAATVSTRILETRRERVITTALLALTIPCSAQLGILLGNIGKLGFLYTVVYILVLLFIFGLIGTVLNRRLRGVSANLLIDLPMMRIPCLQNILRKSFEKTRQFLADAFPVFALGAILLTILSVSGILEQVLKLLSPLVVYGLHLPKEVTEIFLMGMIRRDFGAAQFHGLALNREQSLIAMLTLTLFVPCVASVMMIFKERSAKEAILIWLFGFLLAFGVGSCLAAGFSLMGVMK